MTNSSQHDDMLKRAASVLRVAVVGNVDSGKSTLIGTLCHSTLDDGKGSNRRLIAKCQHEIISGRTSTISSHIMGFDDEARTVTPRSGMRYPDAFIAENSSNLVSLMDLCGHEKYFRTTTTGLSQGKIDIALVLVSASQPPTHMTVHHLNLCVLYNVPIIVVITKKDSAPNDVLKYTMKRVQDTVRDVTHGAKKAYDIRSINDVDLVHNKLNALVPIVKISSVTGDNIDILKKLLYTISPRLRHENRVNRPFELMVEDIFTVPGVGTVLSGFVNNGKYNKGGTLYVGPTKSGGCIKTTVKSIHVMQTTVDHVYAGHSACFAVNLTKEERKSLARRRMFIFDKPVKPTKTFIADIALAKGTPVTMTKGRFQITAHILHQRPSCRLVDFVSVNGQDIRKDAENDNEIVLRPGDQARVKFRLINGSYFVRPGMRFVLRDGPARGVGKITEITE